MIWPLAAPIANRPPASSVNAQLSTAPASGSLPATVPTTIGWFGWKDLRAAFGWQRLWLGVMWERVHGAVVAITLAIAVVLTCYSLLVYVYRYRALFRGVASGAPPRIDGS